MVKEVAFAPWPIYGSPEAPVKVYFSPTCPVCEEAARKILNDPEAATETAFYPIAKNITDEARLARLLRQPGGSVNIAGILGLFEQEPDHPANLSARKKFLLFCNKMVLARADATTVPMIVSSYLFETGRPKNDFSQAIDAVFGTSQGRVQESGCSAFSTEATCGD